MGSNLTGERYYSSELLPSWTTLKSDYCTKTLRSLNSCFHHSSCISTLPLKNTVLPFNDNARSHVKCVHHWQDKKNFYDAIPAPTLKSSPHTIRFSCLVFWDSLRGHNFRDDAAVHNVIYQWLQGGGEQIIVKWECILLFKNGRRLLEELETIL